MVTIDPAPESDGATTISAWANLSISLERLALVFLGLSSVTLSIALLLTWQGYWPVLVIAVLHLVGVGIALRVAWRRNWAGEVVHIEDRRIRVRRNTAGQIREWEQDPHWVRVSLECADHRNEPRLFLREGMERIELGRFLNTSERREFAALIKRGLRPYSILDN